MTLEEFKKDIETYQNNLLSGLDEKIAKLEAKLSGIKLSGIEFEDFEDKIFKFKKRLERVERQKFGYDFTTDDNGEN